MMKKLSFLMLTAILMCGSMAFVACSSDDNEKKVENLTAEMLTGLWVMDYEESGSSGDVTWTRTVEGYQFNADGTGYYECYELDGDKFVKALSTRDNGELHYTINGNVITLTGDAINMTQTLTYADGKLKTAQGKTIEKATEEQKTLVNQLYGDSQGGNSGSEGGVVDLSKVTSDITIQDGDVVLGTLEGDHQVLIADNATVRLAGVTINSTEHAAIRCLGSATIILEDGTTNTLTSAAQYNAALRIGGDNTTLTIQGNTGKLKAATTGLYSAGIGGGHERWNQGCAKITIEGGIIEAQGWTCGAGIGSNEDGRVGLITIKGGNVTATGGWHGAGIGGGKHGYFESFTDIVISGGTVTATGGNGAAGIGNGNQSRDLGHTITITSGITKVTARKGGTEVGEVNAVPIGAAHDAQIGNVIFGNVTVFDGSAWITDPLESGKYGDLMLTVSGNTWTLTPYKGKFTVNSGGKQVIFSPGVLQYKKNEGSYKWRFAEHQYDVVTAFNFEGDWINHFGWGTWTGGSPNPTIYSSTLTQYRWNSSDFAKESELANADERGYNWYTLSSSEWQYLFDHHTYGSAKVHGRNGIIVLPDGMTSAQGFSNGATISDEDWEEMEVNGVLFLPTAGYRDMFDFPNFGNGYYWASGSSANFLSFSGSSVNANDKDYNKRYYGRLVRLVRNAN